jgi:hypothetical protein
MAATDSLPGHEVINPEGKIIRVPAFVMAQLRRMGMLKRSKERHLQRIDGKIYFFMDNPTFLANTQHQRLRGFDPQKLTSAPAKNKVSLISILGRDCSGPQVVYCSCGNCQKKTDSYEPMSFGFANRHVNRQRKRR